MNFKLSLIALMITFGGGFFLAKRQYSKNTSSSESKEENQTHTVVTEVKAKDGTTKTVTTIDSKTQIKAKRFQSIPVKPSEMNYSIMYGRDLDSTNPYFGVSVTRNIFNGITIGGWALNHSGQLIGGVSVGFSF